MKRLILLLALGLLGCGLIALGMKLNYDKGYDKGKLQGTINEIEYQKDMMPFYVSKYGCDFGIENWQWDMNDRLTRLEDDK